MGVSEETRLQVEADEAARKAAAAAAAGNTDVPEETEETEVPTEIRKSELTKLNKQLTVIMESDRSDKVKKQLCSVLKQAQALVLGVTETDLEEQLKAHKQPSQEGDITKKKERMFAKIDLHLGHFCDYQNFALHAEAWSEEQIFYSMLATNELAELRFLTPPEGKSAGYVYMISNAAPHYENAEDEQPKWYKGFYDLCIYGWEEGRRHYMSRRIPAAKSAGVFGERAGRLFDFLKR